MLITIENFGAIKYFQFDTEKDMYLLFGKNSVGKSYAISLVYLILKNLKKVQNYSFVSESEFNFPAALSFATFDHFFLYDSINITNDINKNIVDFLNKRFVQKLNQSIINTFGNLNTLQNNYSCEKLVITIELKNEN